MFLSDLPAALSRATDLDNKITNDTSLISPQYTSLASLAARQTMGGTEVTISLGTDGSWNTSDVMIFMKDIGVSRWAIDLSVSYAINPLPKVEDVPTLSRSCMLPFRSSYTSTLRTAANCSYHCSSFKIHPCGHSHMRLKTLVRKLVKTCLAKLTRRRYPVPPIPWRRWSS